MNDLGLYNTEVLANNKHHARQTGHKCPLNDSS